MRNKSFTYFFLFLLTGFIRLMSQNSDIDSLKKLIASTKNDTNKVDLFYNLSRAQTGELEYASALKSAKMAEVLSKQLNYKRGLAKAYHCIGNVYIQEGNYPDALEYHLKSVQLKEELGDLQGMSASFNNIAKIYNSSENYKEAITYYLKSISLKKKLLEKARENKNENEVRKLMLAVATGSLSMGTALDGENKFDEAIICYNEAMKIFESYNDQDGIAGCAENSGVTYCHMDKFDKALVAFKKVYAMRQADHKEEHLVGTNLNLGKTYLFLHQFKEAKLHLDEALRLSKKIRMTEVVRDSYRGLYELETEKKNYKEGLIYYKRFIQLRDSISNGDVIKKMTRLKLKHEHTKTEKELRMAQEKKEMIDKKKSEFQKLALLSIVFVIVLVIGFSIYAAINFKAKQKINKEIAKQKEIIEEKQKDILASINYAKRIQTILLPSEEKIDKILNKLSRK